jgi:hypothetical protein
MWKKLDVIQQVVTLLGPFSKQCDCKRNRRVEIITLVWFYEHSSTYLLPDSGANLYIEK